jgi:hypothetical protein
MTNTPYGHQIKALAPSYDPRHIEAFMRSEHGTLDHLTLSRFKQEVRTAITCIREGGIEFAEKLAKSYGF